MDNAYAVRGNTYHRCAEGREDFMGGLINSSKDGRFDRQHFLTASKAHLGGEDFDERLLFSRR
jgi:hypothetical protein